MAKMKCPGCGGWYDGKKCKECLFVLFEDEEKHDHHHGVYGETAPFTPKKTGAPASKPAVSTYFPPKQPKKANGLLRKLIIFALLPAMISIFSTIFTFVSEVGDMVEDLIPASTAPIAIPDDSFPLYTGNGFQIISFWQPGDSINADLPLVMENTSGNPVTVSSSIAAVNGIMTDAVFFYCSANANATAESTLWIDIDTLDALGIDVIETIALYVQAYDADTYDTIDPGTLLIMKTDALSDLAPDLPEGTVLYNSDDFTLSCLGWQETETGEYNLWFYGENRMGKIINLYSSEIYANGTPTESYLWQAFLPETRGFFSVWFDDLSPLDIGSLSQIETLEFSLFAEDTDSMAEIFRTDPLQIHGNFFAEQEN